MRKLLFLLMSTLLLIACESKPTTLYSTTGIVESTDCDRSYNYIILDNNIKYRLNGVLGNPYCKLQKGIEVEIIHTSDLTVEDILLRDSTKIE